jgi:phosphoinositide-3-kinase regulatory subunit 4
MDKLWLTYQLLRAVEGLYKTGAIHGDIKCENAVLTSWDWLFLTDFALYKPCFLPEANNGEFDFYFVSTEKRKCYIAPERFFNTLQPPPMGEADRHKMDIFSVG